MLMLEGIVLMTLYFFSQNTAIYSKYLFCEELLTKIVVLLLSYNNVRFVRK